MRDADAEIPATGLPKGVGLYCVAVLFETIECRDCPLNTSDNTTF
jgi:hypothetical protein